MICIYAQTINDFAKIGRTANKVCIVGGGGKVKRLMGMLVVAALLLTSPLFTATAAAQGFTFEVPKTSLEVSQVGEIDVRAQIDDEGKMVDFRVDGREYFGMDVEFMLNGMSFMAHHLTVTNNLDGEDMMGDHEGTITVMQTDGSELVLEYKGEAEISHMMNAVKVMSQGDFKVTDATGSFDDMDFEGVEGTYMMKIVEYGKDVGSKVGFSFCGKEAAEE